MEHIAVEARPRASHLTKGERKDLRRHGMILGSVYGRGMDSVSVLVEGRDIVRLFQTEAGKNTLIDLKLDGKQHLVRVTNIETDPISRVPLHVGLQKISAREPQKVSIPVEFVGEPEAVRINDAHLEGPSPVVDVRALPESLVPSLTIDISEMSVGDVKRAGDISLPQGFELLSDPEMPLVSLRPNQLVVEEAETSAESAETAGDAANASSNGTE
jgi:large subunit ribosomal protein L25